MFKIAHNVKCLYCGQTFNRDKTPCQQVTAKRYAHIDCFKLNEAKTAKEEKDKKDLEIYILNLFHLDALSPRIRQQIKSYIQDNNYTYSGILKALVYFFEVKGNSIEKANGGIGIVPFVYQDAYNYYYNLWLINQKNLEKIVTYNSYQPEVREVVITPPRKEIKKRRLFTFLDEEQGG